MLLQIQLIGLTAIGILDCRQPNKPHPVVVVRKIVSGKYPWVWILVGWEDKVPGVLLRGAWSFPGVLLRGEQNFPVVLLSWRQQNVLLLEGWRDQRMEVPE